eukprot:2442934-Pyramimonas_sp.AAC.1
MFTVGARLVGGERGGLGSEVGHLLRQLPLAGGEPHHVRLQGRLVRLQSRLVRLQARLLGGERAHPGLQRLLLHGQRRRVALQRLLALCSPDIARGEAVYILRVRTNRKR